MGVSVSPDERCRCDRRNRVVLVPRRWDQVSRDSDVGPSARHAAIAKRRWQQSPVTGKSTY